ncbi:MAG: AraC-type DNA-binding protein [Nocardioides sp.]|nr:AraC-type DNA-binding protein [Nocardioides sp.]
MPVRRPGPDSIVPSRHPHGEEDVGTAPVGTHLRARATCPDEAEEILSRHYLSNRLHLRPGSRELEMEFAGLKIGAITAGRLSYGHGVRLVTEEATNFHVNMPVRGHAVSRRGQSRPVHTAVGQGLVFSPESPAEISWSADCVQLCLMIPRGGLEAELERLLGRSVRAPLRFDFGVAPDRASGRLGTVLDLVAQELDRPSGLATSHVAGRHVEALVLDGLLLGQSHNYSAAALGLSTRAPGGAIKRALDLIEEQPAEPWTSAALARELHLSVRALQAGFKREVGLSPMAHLRSVRLRRAHTALREADPADTTVQGVAVSLGLLHQGRFAADYRAVFGEMPSETLHR